MKTIMLGRIDALNPKADQVDVIDMIAKLARLPRWCGAGPLSVLQHMMHVGRILHDDGESRSTVLCGFTHDLHEFATNDLPAPLLDELYINDYATAALIPLKTIQARIQAAIEARLGIDTSDADPLAVDRADTLAREHEYALATRDDGYPPWLKTQIANQGPGETAVMYMRGLEQLGVTL